jgi:hypothetical protein
LEHGRLFQITNDTFVLNAILNFTAGDLTLEILAGRCRLASSKEFRFLAAQFFV